MRILLRLGLGLASLFLLETSYIQAPHSLFDLIMRSMSAGILGFIIAGWALKRD